MCARRKRIYAVYSGSSIQIYKRHDTLQILYFKISHFYRLLLLVTTEQLKQLFNLELRHPFVWPSHFCTKDNSFNVPFLISFPMAWEKWNVDTNYLYAQVLILFNKRNEIFLLPCMMIRKHGMFYAEVSAASFNWIFISFLKKENIFSRKIFRFKKYGHQIRLSDRNT